jgi:formylglycine-generating enzyme required for sulfatase activity
MNPRWILALTLPATLLSAAGCYRHARRDAPSEAPSHIATALVGVPGGTFTMGDQNGEPDEYPERSVSVGSFRLEKFEVSNAQYRACVAAKACDPAPWLDDANLGKDDHPVVGATWLDAERYCAWIGRRLPTEAEWEYAARGPDLRKWTWTGAFDPKRANTQGAADGYALTAPVASFGEGASPFAASHLCGNAAEWVADYYDPTYHRTGAGTTDPTGPTSGRERVVRGGSYRDPSHLVRVSARRAQIPTEADNTIGFRCARSGG